jgi:hypothetical protein
LSVRKTIERILRGQLDELFARQREQLCVRRRRQHCRGVLKDFYWGKRLLDMHVPESVQGNSVFFQIFVKKNVPGIGDRSGKSGIILLKVGSLNRTSKAITPA